jgi:hypothetical protein
VNEADLIRHFPRLWHMAEDGSFDSSMSSKVTACVGTRPNIFAKVWNV